MAKTKQPQRATRSLPGLIVRSLSWATGIGWRSASGGKGLDAQTLEWLYGEDVNADSGVPVTESTALGLSAVKACVSILAETIGVLPCGVVHRLANGDRERAESHPADLFVHEQPNEDVTISAFKESGQAAVGTRGNGFAFIEHDGAGELRALWNMDGRQTYATRLRDGSLRYVTTDLSNPRVRRAGVDAGGGRVLLAPEQVLHVPGLAFDGLSGLSPVGAMRQTLGLALGLERFNAAALKNGAWLAYALEHPEKLDDDAHKRLVAWFKGNHSGAANAFDPAILEEGMKLHQLSLPGEDALFLATRKFQRREIASWYRVPPHMLADLEGGASYASIEQMGLEFVTYTIGIWIRKWEQELTRKLCGPLERRGRREFYVEFNVDAFLRGNTIDRFSAYKNAREWLSVNEIRQRENLKGIGPKGDTYAEPPNTAGTPGGEPPPPALPPGAPAKPGKAPMPTPPPSKRADALVAFEDVATGAVGRVMRKAHDRALKHAVVPRPEAEAWAAAFFEELATDLADALGPIARTFAPLIEGTPNASERAARTWASVAASALGDAFLDAHAAGTVPTLAEDWIDTTTLDLGAEVVRVVDLRPPD